MSQQQMVVGERELRNVVVTLLGDATFLRIVVSQHTSSTSDFVPLVDEQCRCEVVQRQPYLRLAKSPCGQDEQPSGANILNSIF